MQLHHLRLTVITTLATLLVSIVGGCANNQVEYRQVELRGVLLKESTGSEHPLLLVRGESAIITDPSVATRLSGFFPGLGSGRQAFTGIFSPKNLELVFTTQSGKQIIAYTKVYEYWGSNIDHGDLRVKGDLKSYLEALFTNIEVQRTATQPKE